MAHLEKFVFALLVLFQISPITPFDEASRNAFATDLFKVIASEKPNENVIYSPASIQSCLSLAFIGGEGKTADEIRTALKLGAGDKSQIGQDYNDFLSSEFKASANPNNPTLKMANRIYVKKGLSIVPKFNEIARNHFRSEAEVIDFGDSAAAVKKINGWVAQQTGNKIKNVLQDNAVNSRTSTVLINAIYFKGKWADPFTPELTRKKDFHLSASQKTQVDMMSQEEKMPYGELNDFDAKAIELRYMNSDLSMLIILPNKVDGLKALESKLSSTDLNQISKRLQEKSVEVNLPKFKIEFDVDLKEPLQKLGIKQVFTVQANLSGLFSNSPSQMISNAKHKAFLDVNEAGSEAAAVTVFKLENRNSFDVENFNANHPFVFAIRNNKAVFFAGHVAKL